jgi:hypothetical protein
MVDPEASDLLGLPALEEEDRQVYAWVARRFDAHEEEICAGTALEMERVRACMDRLCRMKLLSPLPETPGRYLAVSPDTARTQLLDHAIQDLTLRQRAVDRIRSGLDALGPLFEAGEASRLGRYPVETLTGPEAFAAAVSYLASRATSLVRVSLPGDMLSDHPGVAEGVLAREAGLRVLYEHAAQFDQPTIGRIEQVSAMGAEVRVRSDGLARLMVFDMAAAVVAVHGNPDGAVVVRDPNIVAFAAEAFDYTWSSARPFPVHYDHERVAQSSDDIKGAIVRLLVEGMEDKLIARRLGVSLRTLQRHVSEIISALGARNRLHAGYLIHRYGLMERTPTWPPARVTPPHPEPGTPSSEPLRP